MVDIVALVRCWYKVGMRRRPHFHQLPTWAQRIFAICVVTPNTKYDVRWYCSRIPSILAPGWERGGGGTLIFSYIRRPGPFLGITFWCFVMNPKDIHKIFIPQKIFIFLKTLKGIEIQNFEPQNGASPRMNEKIIVPPPLHPLLADRNRGRGRPDSNNRKKTLIRVFFVGFFFCNYIFLRFKMVETFIGGGGGGQLFIIIIIFFYFFFWGGGGWGDANPYFYRNLYNLWFFGGGGGGGGGVRTTYSSLDSRMGKK